MLLWWVEDGDTKYKSSKLDFVISVAYRVNGRFLNFLKHTIKPQLEDCSLYAFIKHFIQTSSCKALNKFSFLLMATMQTA